MFTREGTTGRDRKGRIRDCVVDKGPIRMTLLNPGVGLPHQPIRDNLVISQAQMRPMILDGIHTEPSGDALSSQGSKFGERCAIDLNHGATSSSKIG